MVTILTEETKGKQARFISLRWILLAAYTLTGIVPLILMASTMLHSVQGYFLEERKKELMERNRHGDGLMFKLEGDPRIIGCKVLPEGKIKKGLGNFMRDYSLDEFPQFFNVLKGDMSLVGTRPPTVDEWERYEPHHRARLAVRPGITGLWQVSGRSRITDFEEVVRLDTKYIVEWSMGMDMRILFRTVGVVFGRDGAM